jgi:surface polysaccharide O-acyltransferase-like enzyme
MGDSWFGLMKEIFMERNVGRDRLAYVDDVRSFVIFLVVMIHASVTYSGIGGWYVIENRAESLDPLSTVVFSLFNSFNQAWFMGILFFFGGYFAAEGLKRKGFTRFIRDRLLRLGLPLLAYMFVINPLMLYYVAFPGKLQAEGGFLDLYIGHYLGEGMVWSATGPLWFAEALLGFSLILALVMRLRQALPGSAQGGLPSRQIPSVSSLLLIAVAVALAAFAIRIVAPIGYEWMNLMLGFFSAYIALFALGVIGAKGGWFSLLTSGRNVRWLWAVFIIGLPCWFAIVIAGGVLSGNLSSFYGGVTWQSAAYCLWESFIAIGMSIGLTALFANRRKAPGGLSAFFSRNSFSVYVFHPVFLIAITRLFGGWAVAPLAKAAIVGTLAFTATVTFAELVIRRVPLVRKYF